MGRLDLALKTFAVNVEFAEDDPTRASGSAACRAPICTRRATWPTRRSAGAADRLAEQEGHPVRRRLQHAAVADAVRDRAARRACEAWHRHADRSARRRPHSLQDRYEVGVVAMARQPFRLLKDATFKMRERPGAPDPDPVFTQWREEGEGIYATNGAVLGIVMRSSTRQRRTRRISTCSACRASSAATRSGMPRRRRREGPVHLGCA